jgi:hypothetical protein
VALGFLAAFVIPAGMALWLFFAPISKHDLTVGNMLVTRRRILEFAWKNGRLPKSLAELPPMPPGYDPATVDGWGRGFDYETDAKGVVTLQSLGADNAPGGSGENTDIKGVFPARSGEKVWMLPDSSVWIREPGK